MTRVHALALERLPVNTLKSECTNLIIYGGEIQTKEIDVLLGGRSPNAEDLLKTIKARNVADLVRYTTMCPESTARTAKVCLEQAESYPEEVRVLLWNKDVANEATKLLVATKENGGHASRIAALAVLILEAGNDIDCKNLPEKVKGLLSERAAVNTSYWAEKKKKHTASSIKDRGQFQEGRPFFSMNPEKSTGYLNGILGGHQKKFVCRHLALAVKDDTKNVLKSISNKTLDPQKYAELENQCLQLRSFRGAHSVQFTRENFGKLLLRASHGMQVGDRRSFEVSHYLSHKGKDGHAARVFIEKKMTSNRKVSSSKTSIPGFKVSFYEPNVSGDMKHLWVLPEHLGKLSVDDFDSWKTFKESEADVLSMNLGETQNKAINKSEIVEFVNALGDQFIGDDGQLLLAAAEALIWGNETTLSRTGRKLMDSTGRENVEAVEFFSVALRNALVCGWHEAIAALAQLQLFDRLNGQHVTDIFLHINPDNNISMIELALRQGDARVLASFGRLLQNCGWALVADDFQSEMLKYGAKAMNDAIRHDSVEALETIEFLIKVSNLKVAAVSPMLLNDSNISTAIRENSPGMLVVVSRLLDQYKDDLPKDELAILKSALLDSDNAAKALEVSFFNGDPKTVAAIFNMIEIAKLDVKEVVNVLAKADLTLVIKDGHPDVIALVVDLLKKHDEALGTYDFQEKSWLQLIGSAELQPTEIAKILSKSTLALAIQSGALDVLVVLGRLLEKCDRQLQRVGFGDVSAEQFASALERAESGDDVAALVAIIRMIDGSGVDSGVIAQIFSKDKTPILKRALDDVDLMAAMGRLDKKCDGQLLASNDLKDLPGDGLAIAFGLALEAQDLDAIATVGAWVTMGGQVLGEKQASFIAESLVMHGKKAAEKAFKANDPGASAAIAMMTGKCVHLLRPIVRAESRPPVQKLALA